MEDQPNQDPQAETAAEPPVGPPAIDSMMDDTVAEEPNFFSNPWTIVLVVILAGTIVGLPLWWVWAKAPVYTWVKAIISVVLIALMVGLILAI